VGPPRSIFFFFSLAERKMSSLTAQGIKLVVFDMAGTVVDEGGVVYVTLKKALRDGGLSFTEEQFDKFHGANKKEAIA